MKRKRNNGGYVLGYVMIVISVVSTMALAVSSVAIRNLQVQEASVRQLEEQYKAEGEIEKFYAWAMGKTIAEVKDAYDAYNETPNPPADSSVEVTVNVSNETITVTATAGSTKVTAVMTVETSEGDNKITKLPYTSYDISAATGGEGGGGA